MLSSISDFPTLRGFRNPVFADNISHLTGFSNPRTILGTILGIFLLRLIVLRLTNPLAKVPGPEVAKWTDIVYIYHYFMGETPRYVHRLHERYGPIVQLSTNQIDICDIAAVKDIHNTHNVFRKSGYYSLLTGRALPTVFSTRDPKFHGQRRRLLASAVSDTSISKLETQITGLVSLAVQRISEEMQTRKAADILKWWLFMATDIIGELTFGESFRMLETGEKNEYIEDLENIGSSQPFRTTFPRSLPWIAKLLPLPMFTKAARNFPRMQKYSTQSLARYTRMLEEDPNPKQTFFTKIHEKGDLSFEEIRQEAQAYIVAGSDTTSNTLTYLIYSVCTHPDIRRNLTNELAALPENYSDKDLRESPYLNKVISETLRLHAAVPVALPREVPAEGYTYDGHFIPPKTIIATQAYSLHHDPTIFPDPNDFLPERWENPTKEMKDISLPFGGGSRICIGIHLARMELRLATAMFFRKFPEARMSSREGMSEDDMVMKAYFLMNPKGKRCLIEA